MDIIFSFKQHFNDFNIKYPKIKSRWIHAYILVVNEQADDTIVVNELGTEKQFFLLAFLN